MCIYRELLARQIDQQPTYPRISHSSIYWPIYCIVDLRTAQASRAFPPLLARPSYWHICSLAYTGFFVQVYGKKHFARFSVNPWGCVSAIRLFATGLRENAFFCAKNSTLTTPILSPARRGWCLMLVFISVVNSPSGPVRALLTDWLPNMTFRTDGLAVMTWLLVGRLRGWQSHHEMNVSQNFCKMQ